MATRPSKQNFGKRVIHAGGFLNVKYKFNGIRVYNESGSTISADKLVAVVGYDVTKKLPNVVLADADAATHVDVYVALNAIANNTEGFVYKGGLSDDNLDTSGATTVGDALYLSTTAGGFTSTAPSGADDRVLPVGWSTVKSSTVGQIHWHIGKFQKLGTNDFQPGTNAPVNATATLTVTEALHANRVVTLSAVAGFVSTLPAATGTGNKYKFVVNTALTSGTYVISPTGDDTMFGGVLINDIGDTTAATADFFPTASGNNTVTLTFTNVGAGKKGDWLEFTDTATDVWTVFGVLQGETDPVNPFSTV